MGIQGQHRHSAHTAKAEQVKRVVSIVLLLRQGVRFWATPSLCGTGWCCTRRQQAGTGGMKANRKASQQARAASSRSAEQCAGESLCSPPATHSRTFGQPHTTSHSDKITWLTGTSCISAPSIISHDEQRIQSRALGLLNGVSRANKGIKVLRQGKHEDISSQGYSTL